MLVATLEEDEPFFFYFEGMIIISSGGAGSCCFASSSSSSVRCGDGGVADVILVIIVVVVQNGEVLVVLMLLLLLLPGCTRMGCWRSNESFVLIELFYRPDDLPPLKFPPTTTKSHPTTFLARTGRNDYFEKNDSRWVLFSPVSSFLVFYPILTR